MKEIISAEEFERRVKLEAYKIWECKEKGRSERNWSDATRG